MALSVQTLALAVMAGMLSVKLPAVGELGPCSVSVLELPEPLNVTAPVLVVDRPSVAVPVLETLKFEDVSVKAFAPRLKLEAAAPVRLRAPAEVTANVPEVVVDRVRLPPVSLIVKPPVVGPVIVRAVVPENVTSPP